MSSPWDDLTPAQRRQIREAQARRREALLASGEWVEHELACGHTVTYDVHRDNPRPGDFRMCFVCSRTAEVVR